MARDGAGGRGGGGGAGQGSKPEAMDVEDVEGEKGAPVVKGKVEKMEEEEEEGQEQKKERKGREEKQEEEEEEDEETEQVVAAAEARKRTCPDHALPVAQTFFDFDTASKLEMRMLPEFFTGRSASKTPEVRIVVGGAGGDVMWRGRGGRAESVGGVGGSVDT